jgi:hypothetical protein
VAVKVFDQGLTADQAATLAQALNRLCLAPLEHPGIVAPVGAGLNGASVWLAEPYVSGEALEAILARTGPQLPAHVLFRITQLAGTLDFAAAAGIYHGALHPRDILIAPERTLVTGLGVVQALLQAGVRVPMSGAAVSPQRSQGHPVSHADDVFALAAIAYEMLYGRPLADRMHLTAHVTPISGVDEERLRDILHRALADNPAERPVSALTLAEQLQHCMIETHVSAPASHPSVDVDGAAAASITAPVHKAMDFEDIPLRAADTDPPEPVFERHHEAAETRQSPVDLRPAPVVPLREFEFESQARPAPRSLFLPIATAVTIAFTLGFGSGYIVSQRGAIPLPRSAERAIPRADRETPPEPVPSATIGQDFTESTLPPGRVEEPEIKSTESAAGAEAKQLARRESAGTEGVARRDLTGSADPFRAPASVEIVSRPAGAQVFLDERLVGRTPLVVPEVTPGDHAVRISLPGHQRWVTTVSVAAGSRARVAASLER